MFFESVELYKCRRFVSAGHELIRIKPTSKIQLVLGSNGSGKTSLLDIGFSVMPASPNNFYVGGYSDRVVRGHRDDRYRLRTDYKKGSAHHSFINLDTGEELNPGGTLGVQKDLIEEHFGITQDIHDLLIGKKRFTQLPPSKRQEWITRMSEADFDYVLKFYADACRAERANKSVLKHQTERLSSQLSNLLPEAEVARLKERAAAINEELNFLLNERNPYTQDAADIHRRVLGKVKSLMEEGEAFIVKGRSIKAPVFSGGKAMTESDIARIRTNLQAKLSRLDGSAKELAIEHDHLERKLKEIESLEGVDENELKGRLDAIEFAIAEQEKRFSTFNHFKQPLSCQGKTFLRDELDVFGQMLSDHSESVDKETFEKALKDLEAQKSLLGAETIRYNNLNNELDHISKCELVACPSCDTEFKPGVNPNRPEEIRVELNALSGSIHQREEAVDYLSGIVNAYRSHHAYESELRAFMHNHWDLGDLWGMVSQYKLHEKLKILSVCHEYKEALNVTKRYYQLLDDRIPISAAIDKCKLRGDLSGVRERYNYVTARLQEVKGPERKTLTNAANTIDRWDEHATGCKETYKVLMHRVGEIARDFDELEEAIRQKCLHEVMTTQQGSLAEINTTLSRIAVQEGLVEDLKQEVGQLELNAVAYEYLRKILSPEDGIIARQISLHIGRLMNRMNKVISRVWGYPMEILPCGNEDGSLNYKFPIHIKDSDDLIEDIEFGSRSQVDIIDQAFRIIAYKGLGIEGAPLYLDEFGSSFDTLHRNNLIGLLEDIFEDPQFGQVFMISHFVEGYDGFSTAEVIVLDDSNIVVQREANKHVEFA